MSCSFAQDVMEQISMSIMCWNHGEITAIYFSALYTRDNPEIRFTRMCSSSSSFGHFHNSHASCTQLGLCILLCFVMLFAQSLAHVNDVGSMISLFFVRICSCIVFSLRQVLVLVLFQFQLKLYLYILIYTHALERQILAPWWRHIVPKRTSIRISFLIRSLTFGVALSTLFRTFSCEAEA